MLLKPMSIAQMNTQLHCLWDPLTATTTTIMLMAWMGQQACLGSLVCPGIQQETMSEHLVTP